MAECWLYVYENTRRRAIYIGIADRMDRVFQAHNAAAEQLRDEPDTVILQTPVPFGSRRDARKAEAIAIHVATLAGIDVAVEDDDATLLRYTNRSGTVSTAELAPAIFVREGTLDASTLRRTLFVPISPGSIDGRVAPFGGHRGAVFADRVARYWNVGRRQRPRIERAIAVLTGGRNLVLGDWDVDPARDWTSSPNAGSRVEIPLRDWADDDPRGVKGMRLLGHRSNSGVTYSADLR
jgi:predicted GIY-YIG superfamily endonuclease